MGDSSYKKRIRYCRSRFFPLKVPYYFFGYKTSFFSIQNSHKNLDLSYKTDLDVLDCLEMENIRANFHTTDLAMCSHAKEGKSLVL